MSGARDQLPWLPVSVNFGLDQFLDLDFWIRRALLNPEKSGQQKIDFCASLLKVEGGRVLLVEPSFF